MKDNECGWHRQMRNVYAFSFWNLNEFFIAIHKKSINISPGESEGEREGEGREKRDPYGMSCHESPLKQTESLEKKRKEGRRRDGGMFMPRTQTPR